MLQISDEQFNDLIAESLDELPQKYTSRLNNVLITYEDDPTKEQREKLKLRCDQTLYGLYEGIPLTSRGNGYNMVLPDKITIFKKPISVSVSDISQAKMQVKHTLWHEIAHFFGLGHDRIHQIESKWK
jgi:predicted Zn-dependent protease with MMP-like domain